MIQNTKADLRKQASSHRLSLHKRLADQAPVRLLSCWFPIKPTADFCRLSGFYPHSSEIDTRQLLGKLAGEGWTTALPIVVAKGHPLLFRRWLPGEPTEIGAMKIATPLAAAPIVEPDVLLVPLLAFDKAGYRLGYGGGFYDATLKALRATKKIIAIGVAYAGQEISNVPHEAHDMKLDYVMTEEGTVKCG